MIRSFLHMPWTLVSRITIACIFGALLFGLNPSRAAANDIASARISNSTRGNGARILWDTCTTEGACTYSGLEAAESMEISSDTHPTKEAGACWTQYTVYPEGTSLLEFGCTHISAQAFHVTGGSLSSATLQSTTVPTTKVLCDAIDCTVESGSATVSASWSAIGPRFPYSQHFLQTWDRCTDTFKYTADYRAASTAVNVNGQSFSLTWGGDIFNGSYSSSMACH